MAASVADIPAQARGRREETIADVKRELKALTQKLITMQSSKLMEYAHALIEDFCKRHPGVERTLLEAINLTWNWAEQAAADSLELIGLMAMFVLGLPPPGGTASDDLVARGADWLGWVWRREPLPPVLYIREEPV